MNGKNLHPRYIWQRSDWPNFRWDRDSVLDSLSRLSNLHGILKGRLSAMGIKTRENAVLTAMTDEITNSSEIEGVALHPQSVRSSIARKLGIQDDGLLFEDHYVEGLVDVMFDAVNHCKDGITSERLFGWHAALFPLGRSGMNKITVGDWRKGDEPMQVVSGAMGHETIHFEAPPSKEVANEMTSLMQWVNSSNLSPFIMAAIAHLWLVTIHPFDDGNGRISRTLTDMVIARMDTDGNRYYSMSAEINRRKKEYYNILESTQKGNMEITPWITWFISTLENAIKRTLEMVETTLQKSRFWDTLEDVAINERQRKIINRLWDNFEGKLTSSKWAKICHCSQDTASRDIKDLIVKGILKESGEGGRSTNYLLVKNL